MKLIDDVLESIGINAKAIKRLGLFIVFLPTISDVVKLGILRFFEWNIGNWGVVCMFIGGLIIYFAEKIRSWLVGE